MLSGFLCKMLVNGILSYFFNTRNDISNHFPSKNTQETLFLTIFRPGAQWKYNNLNAAPLLSLQNGYLPCHTHKVCAVSLYGLVLLSLPVVLHQVFYILPSTNHK